MSHYTESTTEWYIRWLEETRPYLTPAQRQELATGFVAAQQPPEKPKEEPPDYDEIPLPDPPSKRRHLTGKELTAILNLPSVNANQKR